MTTALIFVATGATSQADVAEEALPTWLVIVGYVVVLGLLLSAGLVADRAAKAAGRDVE